ncbi:MAG: DNRLRE domain-containing protein [Candidatus Auribacter fodinae]|jgi:hypothetical protein|uniref:DNRLRE domain-containing protein n=1 Tax=Candidatus Auribacter fodinae TaxID=2093366 RepID=A0A3A4RC23_9BACT|nr:MAG: DNRLRE domain-containing protein [Candidatus Auribacter fodinae]
MILKIIFLTILFTGILCITSVSYAATVTIQPGYQEGIDTYIHDDGTSSTKTLNFGSRNYIAVTNSTSHRQYALIKFDISQISQHSVTSASLSLFNTAGATNKYLNVYRVTSGWDEMTVTFQHVINGSLTYTGPSTVKTYIPDGYTGWVNWDVTTYVNEWLSGTENYGFIIICHDNEFPNEKDFVSSDDNVIDPSFYPKLTLDGVETSQVPEPATVAILGLSCIITLIRNKIVR